MGQNKETGKKKNGVHELKIEGWGGVLFFFKNVQKLEKWGGCGGYSLSL